MKNLRKYLDGLLILTGLLLVTSIGFLVYSLLKGDGSQVIETGNEISYKLNAHATEVQKVYFDELKASLTATEADPYAIVAAVVKNYIADFYTWSNKQGSFDVGGLQYVYGDNILYIQVEAKAYFYKDLSYFIEKYGSDNLLQVDSVTIKYVDPEQHFMSGDQAYASYYVGAEWTYKSNDVFDASTYQTKGYFSVVYKDGKYQIYRYYRE